MTRAVLPVGLSVVKAVKKMRSRARKGTVPSFAMGMPSNSMSTSPLRSTCSSSGSSSGWCRPQRQQFVFSLHLQPECRRAACRGFAVRMLLCSSCSSCSCHRHSLLQNSPDGHRSAARGPLTFAVLVVGWILLSSTPVWWAFMPRALHTRGGVGGVDRKQTGNRALLC